ncbi:hypothetical protein M422DRAFT_47132 [Sphaerobolus stellatus SS14]|uniref:Uncharacterized protein n=1 Tax=Sphaerobolus stellatus (strain SS14) TaxID=990650 RepID=A0A0C9UQ41_SPHS4|nr:hypothetical protein M422DRAFT_47132 [Sphaerobolus stellatus SS14]
MAYYAPFELPGDDGYMPAIPTSNVTITTPLGQTQQFSSPSTYQGSMPSTLNEPHVNLDVADIFPFLFLPKQSSQYQGKDDQKALPRPDTQYPSFHVEENRIELINSLVSVGDQFNDGTADPAKNKTQYEYLHPHESHIVNYLAQTAEQQRIPCHNLPLPGTHHSDNYDHALSPTSGRHQKLAKPDRKFQRYHPYHKARSRPAHATVSKDEEFTSPEPSQRGLSTHGTDLRDVQDHTTDDPGSPERCHPLGFSEDSNSLPKLSNLPANDIRISSIRKVVGTDSAYKPTSNIRMEAMDSETESAIGEEQGRGKAVDGDGENFFDEEEREGRLSDEGEEELASKITDSYSNVKRDVESGKRSISYLHSGNDIPLKKRRSRNAAIQKDCDRVAVTTDNESGDETAHHGIPERTIGLPEDENRLTDKDGKCTYCGKITPRHSPQHFYTHVQHEFRKLQHEGRLPSLSKGYGYILDRKGMLDRVKEYTKSLHCPDCRKRLARIDSKVRHMERFCPSTSKEQKQRYEAENARKRREWKKRGHESLVREMFELGHFVVSAS